MTDYDPESYEHLRIALVKLGKMRMTQCGLSELKLWNEISLAWLALFGRSREEPHEALDVRGLLESRGWVSDDEGNWARYSVHDPTVPVWMEEDEALAQEGIK